MPIYRLASAFALFLLLLAGQLFAQTPIPPKWKTNIVAPNGLKVGETVTIEWIADIAPGMHWYSAIPSPNGAYKSTIVEFEEIKGQYEPQGKLGERGKMHSEYDKIMEGDLNFYDKEVVFFQKIKILKANPTIAGFLSGQVCSDNACQPEDYNFIIPVKTVEDLKVETPKQDDTVKNVITVDTPKKDTPSADTSGKTGVPSPKDGGGDTGCDLWLIFITAFGAGLVALLTPCVFPMIPMTVSFFTKRAETKAKGTRDAIIYSLSIILTFTIVGTSLVLSFGSSALTNLATDGLMNLFFFALLLFFAFSFFGWYEISLPSSWSTRMDQLSERGGILGIYFMALTLVIASFSCVGGFLGFLLPLFDSGSIICPLVGMFGFSIGFAIPFTIFALFPSMMKKLPKSGGWLNVVKVVLGFIEFGLAFKFLSNTDLQWDWHFLDREIFIGIWIVCSALLGAYLMGWYKLPHDTVPSGDSHSAGKIPVLQLILAICSFSFTMYLIPGLWGAPLSQLSGILPPNNYDVGVRLAPVHGQSGGGGSAKSEKGEVCNLPRKYAEMFAEHTPDGYCTFFDLEEALAYGKKVKKPVFVDFTGVNCANCREVESLVWSDPSVRETLTKEYVMVSLFTDKGEKLPQKETMPNGDVLRTLGDKWKYYEKIHYGQSAAPYYVLVTPEMKSLGEGMAYTRDKAAYLKFLKDGLARFKSQK